MPSFTTLVSTVIVALFICLQPTFVNAGITAFSGNNCDGGVGADVPCDGRCIAFSGRHSFRVDAGSGGHCVTFYADSSCPSGGGNGFFPNQNGQCTQVTLGTGTANAMRCVQDENCAR